MTVHADEAVLLCPRNDEESVLILKIAKAFDIPTVVSPQSHGSRLEREVDLEARLKKANPKAKKIVIVEVPGPEREKELEKAGYEVVIIDHHRYEGIDRMKPISSLEQFLEVFDIHDGKLTAFGFDPFLVKGVGLMDRGWIWELKKEGLNKTQVKQVLDYYLTLLDELGGLQKEAMDEARRAYENREEKYGVMIVRSRRDDFRIREPFSILMAEEFDEPPTALIIEGNRRISLQDSEKALDVYKKYGGYVFGKDRCWGFAPNADRPAPTVDEILEVVK